MKAIVADLGNDDGRSFVPFSVGALMSPPTPGQYVQNTPLPSGFGASFDPNWVAPQYVPSPLVSVAPAPVVQSAPVLTADEFRNRQRYAESAFNNSAVSGAGAKGVFQIMPSVLNDYVASGGKEGDLFDYEYNRSVRDWYVDWLLKRAAVNGNGNEQSDAVKWAKLAAAYNWGIGNLGRYLQQQKENGVDIYNSTDWVDGLNPETRDYVKFVALQQDTSKTRSNEAYKKALENAKVMAMGGTMKKLSSAYAGDAAKMLEVVRRFKSGGNLDGDEKDKNKTGNWFTRATLNAAMADAPAVMQASGWDYDNNGNLVQGDPNSEGAQRLASTLAEIASIPLTDVVLGTTGAAIAGTKAYKSFKLARELNKALKSGALEGKGTVLREAPVVRAAELTDDVAANAKKVTGYDMDLHNLRDRYNKFAEFYGYETVPKEMTDEAAEQLIKKNLERHNTFYRGVAMPYTEYDKAQLLEALGSNYSEDDALRYIVEKGRGSDTYLATDARAAQYGDGKHVGEVVRKYALGESPSTWLQDADFVYDATPATGSAPAGKVNYPWASYYENLTVPGEVRMNTGDYVFKRWLPANERVIRGNTYYEIPQDAFQGSLNKYVRTEDVYNDGQFYRAYEKPEFSFGGLLLKPYHKFEDGGQSPKSGVDIAGLVKRINETSNADFVRRLLDKRRNKFAMGGPEGDGVAKSVAPQKDNTAVHIPTRGLLENSVLDWDAKRWLDERAENDRGPKYTDEDVKIFESHVPEYKQIEQRSKIDGTWLKMPDGSTWQGDPRDWVVMQSEAFKNNYLPTPWWTGQKRYVKDPDTGSTGVNRARYYDGTLWFSDNPDYAKTFSDVLAENDKDARRDTVTGHVFLAGVPNNVNIMDISGPANSTADMWYDMPYGRDSSGNIVRLPDEEIIRRQMSAPEIHFDSFPWDIAQRIRFKRNKYNEINRNTTSRPKNQKVVTDSLVDWASKLGAPGVYLHSVDDGPLTPQRAVYDPEYGGTIGGRMYDGVVDELITLPGLTPLIKFIHGNNGDFDPRKEDKYSSVGVSPRGGLS